MPSSLIKHKSFSKVGREVLRLGSFYSLDVLGLGRFMVGMFWGLGHFEALDVLELGRFGVGRFGA